jgi:hypothetical protein
MEALDERRSFMLVLKRKEGEWVNIVHRSGDTIRVRVYDIRGGEPGRTCLAFDDSARNFAIERPERIVRRVGFKHPPNTSGP